VAILLFWYSYLLIDLLAGSCSPVTAVFTSWVIIYLSVGSLVFSMWITMNSSHVKEINPLCMLYWKYLFLVYHLILTIKGYLFGQVGFFSARKFQSFWNFLNNQLYH
jgi:hypothetical protein